MPGSDPTCCLFSFEKTFANSSHNSHGNLQTLPEQAVDWRHQPHGRGCSKSPAGAWPPNVASISAAGHCFFVVGGLLLQQIADLTARGPAARCQCEVLVSSNVQQQVRRGPLQSPHLLLLFYILFIFIFIYSEWAVRGKFLPPDLWAKLPMTITQTCGETSSLGTLLGQGGEMRDASVCKSQVFQVMKGRLFHGGNTADRPRVTYIIAAIKKHFAGPVKHLHSPPPRIILPK